MNNDGYILKGFDALYVTSEGRLCMTVNAGPLPPRLFEVVGMTDGLTGTPFDRREGQQLYWLANEIKPYSK